MLATAKTVFCFVVVAALSVHTVLADDLRPVSHFSLKQSFLLAVRQASNSTQFCPLACGEKIQRRNYRLRLAGRKGAVRPGLLGREQADVLRWRKKSLPKTSR